MLAQIASRRWDLHPLIIGHPRAYPELRQWIASVNPNAAASAYPTQAYPATTQYYPGPASAPQYYPAAQYYPIATSQPVPPPRRSSGCWLVGCSIVGIVMVVIVAISFFTALGSALSTPSTQPSAEPWSSDPQSTNEYLAEYQTELATIRSLASALDGNPVAPILIDEPLLARLDVRASEPSITEYGARNLVDQIRTEREELEQAIAAAEQRRANVSGTVSEALVDEAGNGFIDIIWDASDVCGASERGADWDTVGCVRGGDPLTVHLTADLKVPDSWQARMITVHELAHVFQRADARRFEDRHSDADRLLEQGYFQGSEEAMADCYALTYYGEWSLHNEGYEIGYGYVCNDDERAQIRSWASTLHAPMPG